MKYKKVLVLSASPAGGTAHLGVNFNGKEYTASSSDVDTALWTNYGGGAAVSHALVPDDYLQNNLFDQCRLAGLSIKWFPGIPNGAQIADYTPMTITWDKTGIEKGLLNTTIADQMEQVNGVRTKNVYKPWKMYFKAPKYRIRTRVPSIEEKSSASAYSPNLNIAGQWKRPGDPLVGSGTFNSDMNGLVERATHLLCTIPAPVVQSEEETVTVGTFLLTSYYVYHDRV